MQTAGGGGEERAASEQLTTSLLEKTENCLKGSSKSSGLNELNTRLNNTRVFSHFFPLLINRWVVVSHAGLVINKRIFCFCPHELQYVSSGEVSQVSKLWIPVFSP